MYVTAVGFPSHDHPAVQLHTHDGTGGNSTITGGINELDPGKAIASAPGAVAYGDYTQATGAGSIAIGTYAYTERDGGISIGESAHAVDTYDIAIGANTLGGYISGGDSIGIGRNAKIDGASQGIAIGFTSLVNSTAHGGTAIGSGAVVSGLTGFAAGYGAIVNANGGIAIGTSALITANASGGIAIGENTYSDAQQATAIGENSSALSSFAVVLGSNTVVQTNSSYSVAIGSGSIIWANTDHSVALGSQSVVDTGHEYSTALGPDTYINYDWSVALGASATPTKDHQVRLGTASEIASHPGGVEYRVNAKSIDYTANSSSEFDFFIPVDALGANRTITLPAANGIGQVLNVKKVDSSANTVTVDGNGTDTIDGALTFVLVNQYDSITIIDAAAGIWMII